MTYHAPAIDKKSFNCPHCGAHTHQHWYDLIADRMSSDSLPFLWEENKIKELITQEKDPELKKTWERELNVVQENLLHIEKRSDSKSGKPLTNIWISECYTCHKIAVWIREKLIYPASNFEMMANADLPSDIKTDFEEAVEVFTLSPRSSAALLRLCVQKLCTHLGAKGSSINDQIADLVSRGLDEEIQQALDIVRVIGNNAVHPGTINLNDDPSVAETLFSLVNMIAETMISKPKKLKELYQNLPKDALEQIEKRNLKIKASQ